MSNIICKRYCPYYREEKKDIGYCYPLKILNNIVYSDYPECEVFKNRFYVLKEIFCQNCEFYPSDCDFNNGADGLPCGGYIFTELLLSKGMIDIDWLKEISKTIR